MTTYTMTITDVQAWQVAPDGSLPDDAKSMMGDNDDPRWREGEQYRWTLTPDSDPLSVERVLSRYAHWVWYDHGTSQLWMAAAGDWVVSHDFGVSAMSDEQFRSACREVDDAS